MAEYLSLFLIQYLILTKFQCDRKDPACSQCRRASKECPGYRDELSLLFRDENEKTLRKAYIQRGAIIKGQLARRNVCQRSEISEKSDDSPDTTPFVSSSSVNGGHFNQSSLIPGIHGYKVVKTKHKPRPKSTVQGQHLPLKSLVKPYISSQPSTAIFEYEEQPYFQLFYTTTIQELSGYFNSELWSRLIL